MVDLEAQAAFVRLSQLIRGWIEEAGLLLAPYVEMAAFPWRLVQRYLRLGSLIDYDGEDPDGIPGAELPVTIIPTTTSWLVPTQASLPTPTPTLTLPSISTATPLTPMVMPMLTAPTLEGTPAAEELQRSIDTRAEAERI